MDLTSSREGFAKYLPSGGFAWVAGSCVASVVIIGAAWWYVTPRASTAAIASSGSSPASDTAWQTEFSSSTMLSQDQALQQQAEQIAQEASTSNLTESIGRALLVRYAAAQGQGLGSDQPTQDQISSAALSQVAQAVHVETVFSLADAHSVPDSPAALRDFGNALAVLVNTQKRATYAYVMVSFDMAAENHSATTAGYLAGAASDYRALARQVIALPVPASLANDAVQVANEYINMADACDLLGKVIADPASGLAGLQEYSQLANSAIATFSDIATVLQTSRVSFAATDPGSTWATFLAVNAEEAPKRAQAAAQAATQDQMADDSQSSN